MLAGARLAPRSAHGSRRPTAQVLNNTQRLLAGSHAPPSVMELCVSVAHGLIGQKNIGHGEIALHDIADARRCFRRRAREDLFYVFGVARAQYMRSGPHPHTGEPLGLSMKLPHR